MRSKLYLKTAELLSTPLKQTSWTSLPIISRSNNHDRGSDWPSINRLGNYTIISKTRNNTITSADY